MICRDCKRIHAGTIGECPFDWSGIRAAEQRARDKAKTLPRCRVCGGPMWLEQSSRHHVCKAA